MLFLIWADEKYNTPKKIPVLFSQPQKIPASFIDPKNPFWPKCQTQKNPSDPPVIKICEWGPWSSNTGYRLVISIFCRCRSGPNFPFTTASDTFPSSLNVRSKSLNLCTFEISLWNCDFCRPKARFYVTRLAHFGPPSWNFLFTVPRFLAAPAKLG